MRNEKSRPVDDIVLIVRIARVMERIGLGMAGAMCGTFVAALLAKACADLFDSATFVAMMVLAGVSGFCLGIDIPALRSVGASAAAARPGIDRVELLSAVGTFLAATAALLSVYSFVFDEVAQRDWDLIVGSWWMLGVALQISAGLTGRLRPVASVAR
jgi:hypothetical protein